MSCAIIRVDQRFAVKKFGASCLASIFDLSNRKMKIQHVKDDLTFARYDESYTIIFCKLIRIRGLLV